MKTYFEYCLEEMENSLMNDDNWYSIELSKSWLNNFDNLPGVYVIREDDEILYVGESGCIRKRMKDLSDTRNHSLRRSISKQHFIDDEGYIAENSSKKMPTEFEEKLNSLLLTKFKVSTITVEFGRKELEEHIVEKYNPIYNSRKRRGVDDSKSYSLNKIRETHKSAYTPWTESEELRLVNLRSQKMSTNEISQILGRNEGAIKSRLRKIGERNL